MDDLLIRGRRAAASDSYRGPRLLAAEEPYFDSVDRDRQPNRMAGSRTDGVPAQTRAMVRSAVSDHHEATKTA